MDSHSRDLTDTQDLAIGVPSREGTGEERREMYFLLSIQLYYLLLLLLIIFFYNEGAYDFF